MVGVLLACCAMSCTDRGSVTADPAADQWVQAAPVTPPEPVSFNRDIRPILSKNCYFCHGPDQANNKSDLRLDRRDDALGMGALVPGRPDRQCW